MNQRRRMFLWNGWANRASLRSLRSLVTPPRQAVLALAHIVAGERLWRGRIDGEPPGEVWPNLSLDECEAGIEEMEGRWLSLLDESDADSLQRAVTYVNTPGRTFSSQLADILDHVLVHSAYHRGQVASWVREAGGEPAVTDFMHAVRSQLIPD